MVVKVAERRYTPEDLLAMPDGAGFELVDGHLVERNVSVLSSLVEGIVYDRVANHARTAESGLVWPSSMGYQFFTDDPLRVRKPDISFIRKERLSRELLDSGFIKIAPDLAVEVLSPHDLAYEVDQKVEEYFSDGVQLVWIINPELRTVTVHHADGTATKLNENDILEGGEVLSGFRCPVRELFPDEAKMKALGLS